MVRQSYKDLIRAALVKSDEKDGLQSISYVNLYLEALMLKYDFIDGELEELDKAMEELAEEGVLVQDHVHHGSTHYGLRDIHERDSSKISN